MGTELTAALSRGLEGMACRPHAGRVERSERPVCPSLKVGSWPAPPVRVRAGQQLVSSGTTGGRAADFGTPPNLKFSFLAVLLLASPGHNQSLPNARFSSTNLQLAFAVRHQQGLVKPSPARAQ